jgi:hypothetical protein
MRAGGTPNSPLEHTVSSTTATTYYTISYGLSDPTSPFESSGTFNFLSSEMDDAQAFAFLDAVQKLPLPTGVTINASVTKQEQTSTSWTTDLTSTPPSFT